MSDNGGALQATAFERTKRGEQVVESTLQPDLCAIVRLQQLLLQDNAESKASDPQKEAETSREGWEKRLLVMVTRQAWSVCVSTELRRRRRRRVKQHIV